MFYVVYLCKKIQTTYKMKTIDPTTLIIYLTVGQYLDLRRLERTLQEPTKKEFQKYLNPTQLSELIGWKITTVYQNHHNGLIPGAKKIGNRLLFDSAIILSWIEENSIPTKAEKVRSIEDRLQKNSITNKRGPINGK
jgi:hypothetical protein